MDTNRTHAKSGMPRWVEILLSGVGLLALSPIFILCAICIRVSSPGPVFFRQSRVGQNGIPFMLIKFRSMTHGSKGLGVTAGDDLRITSIGRILRKLKLDEIPELWNILTGTMSFVGPRPEVPEYVDMDNELWKQVLNVRPGLTDPVTLRLRNEEELLSLVQGDRNDFYINILQPFKLKGYLRYINTRNPFQDFLVIFKTLAVVIIPGLASPPDLEEIKR